MAGEVNHHVGYSRENECWFVRFYPYQTEQQANEAAAAFTRPTPAATVTRLKTVMRRYRGTDWPDHYPWAFLNESECQGEPGPRWTIEKLCLQSQAEELLAAKDETIRLLHQHINDWEPAADAEKLLAAERAKYRDAMEKLVESQRETLVWQQRAIDLKADNAAKDAQLERFRADRAYTVGFTVGHDAAEAKLAAQAARIKELETERDEALDDAKFAERIATKREIDANANVEALKAKLAAAEKALEPLADIADLIDAETEGMAETDELVLHFHDYEFAKWPVSFFRKARAVLGSKFDNAKNRATITYHLEWIAGARPPVHPEPMSGRQSFESFDQAIEFMKRQAPDAQFVSLTERTIIQTDEDRSTEARAVLGGGPEGRKSEN